MNRSAFFETEGVYQPDNLIAGGFPEVLEKGVIAQGQGVLRRGTVLGQLTANDELVVIDKNRTDGGEQIHGVLQHDVDTTGSSVEDFVYLTGMFNEDYIASVNGFGGDTVSDHRKAARLLNIYFKQNVEI